MSKVIIFEIVSIVLPDFDIIINRIFDIFPFFLILKCHPHLYH